MEITNGKKFHWNKLKFLRSIKNREAVREEGEGCGTHGTKSSKARPIYKHASKQNKGKCYNERKWSVTRSENNEKIKPQHVEVCVPVTSEIEFKYTWTVKSFLKQVSRLSASCENSRDIDISKNSNACKCEKRVNHFGSSQTCTICSNKPKIDKRNVNGIDSDGFDINVNGIQSRWNLSIRFWTDDDGNMLANPFIICLNRLSYFVDPRQRVELCDAEGVGKSFVDTEKKVDNTMSLDKHEMFLASGVSYKFGVLNQINDQFEMTPAEVNSIIGLSENCNKLTSVGYKNMSISSKHLNKSSGDLSLVVKLRLLKQDSHCHSLSSDLRSLINDDKSADLVVEAGGKSFKVHRNILAARSPVFANILAETPIEIDQASDGTTPPLKTFVLCSDDENKMIKLQNQHNDISNDHGYSSDATSSITTTNNTLENINQLSQPAILEVSPVNSLETTSGDEKELKNRASIDFDSSFKSVDWVIGGSKQCRKSEQLESCIEETPQVMDGDGNSSSMPRQPSFTTSNVGQDMASTTIEEVDETEDSDSRKDVHLLSTPEKCSIEKNMLMNLMINDIHSSSNIKSGRCNSANACSSSIVASRDIVNSKKAVASANGDVGGSSTPANSDVSLKMNRSNSVGAKLASKRISPQAVHTRTTPSPGQTSTEKIEIKDLNSDVLEHLLNYIYTDSLSTIDTKANSLLMASEIYQLPGLKEHCEKQLGETMSPSNVASLLLLSDQSSSSSLKKAALKYCVDNQCYIMKDSTWKCMEEGNPQLFAEAVDRVTPEVNCGPGTHVDCVRRNQRARWIESNLRHHSGGEEGNKKREINVGTESYLSLANV